MKKILLSVCFFYFIIQSVIAHPFYVSVTQIDFKDNSLQITLKVFVEDLESALESQNHPKINLGESNQHANTAKIIQAYLDNRFEIKLNDAKQNCGYLGNEVEDDAVWIYLEIKDVQRVSALEVTNSIITEKYESQTNLIHTNINGEKKSLILNKYKPTDQLTF